MSALTLDAIYCSELLPSQFLNQPRDNLEASEAAVELREKVEEQELLLEFLLLVQQRKQKVADKLQDTVSLLYSDIGEVQKQQVIPKDRLNLWKIAKDGLTSPNLPLVDALDNDDSASSGSRKQYRAGFRKQNPEECCEDVDDGQMSNAVSEKQYSFLLKSSRLMKNFKRLESAYYLTRCQSIKPSHLADH